MKSRRISIFVILILFLISLYDIDAQPKHIQFGHLTTDNGLSNSWVHSIIQDKYGFIWIATEDGLNLYDGNNFKVYKNNYRDQYSICNNGILCLLEDSKGNLWIGTRAGLVFYDRINERFIRHSGFSQRIKSIAEDKSRVLWIGADNGLYSLDLTNDSINQWIGGNITKILVDSRNKVWIGTTTGLHLYDREKNIFIDYYHDKNIPNSISSNQVYSILEDKTKRLWIGTSDGLDLLTNNQELSSKGIFIHHENITGDKNSISKGLVLCLYEDDKYNLWIGIENGGLDIINLKTYDKNTASFSHFKNDPDKERSLSNNSIYSITQDKQGNIWICTFGKGINIVNPLGDRFIHYKNDNRK